LTREWGGVKILAQPTVFPLLERGGGSPFYIYRRSRRDKTRRKLGQNFTNLWHRGTSGLVIGGRITCPKGNRGCNSQKKKLIQDRLKKPGTEGHDHEPLNRKNAQGGKRDPKRGAGKTSDQSQRKHTKKKQKNKQQRKVREQLGRGEENRTISKKIAPG